LRLSNGLLADAVLLRRDENLADMKSNGSQGDGAIYSVSKPISCPCMEARCFGSVRWKIADWLIQEPDPQNVYKAMRKSHLELT
jgi:hypothetical protein